MSIKSCIDEIIKMFGRLGTCCVIAGTVFIDLTQASL